MIGNVYSECVSTISLYRKSLEKQTSNTTGLNLSNQNVLLNIQ